jgi:hypothetical protein
VPRVPGDAVVDGAASVARLALYLDGTVETLAYCLAATGDNHKATRVLDWYYRGAGATQLVGTLKARTEICPSPASCTRW